jgi:hypothetical protein
MATVPIYEPRVRTEALRPAFQNTPDVSSGSRALAQGLGQAADAIDRIAERDAQTKAFDAESKITAEWLQWDGKARAQYRGENVDGYEPAAQDWWKKASADHGKDLDPRARALVNKSLSGKQLQALGSVAAFTNAEKERHADDVYAADMASTIRFALNSGGVDAAVPQITGKAAARAARKGWTTEQLQQETVAQLSALHVGAMRGLIQAGNADAAAQYFEAHRETMTEQAKAAMQGAVKESSENSLAESAAGAVWQDLGPKALNDPVKLFDMEQQLRERLRSNPETTKKAIDGLRQRSQAFNAQQAEVKAANTSKVWGMLDSGANLRDVTRSDAWLALAEADRRDIRRSLEAEQATRAQRQAAEAARDFTTLQRNEHRQLLVNGGEYLTASDPEVLSSMSRAQVEALRGRFGLEGTKHLLNKWEGLQKPGKLIEARFDKEDFDQVADSLGLKPFAKDISEGQKRALGTLKYRVEQLIDVRQGQEKRPLNRQEKMDLMSQEMARTVAVSGWFADEQVPVVQLDAKQAAKVVVPPAERLKVVEALREMYRRDPSNPAHAPTDENVRRVYLLNQSKAASLIIK